MKEKLLNYQKMRRDYYNKWMISNKKEISEFMITWMRWNKRKIIGNLKLMNQKID